MPVLRNRYSRVRYTSSPLSPSPASPAELAPINQNDDKTQQLPPISTVAPLPLRKQLVNDPNLTGQGFDIHSRPYVCEYKGCQKAFARKSDLARHFKIHTNDR